MNNMLELKGKPFLQAKKPGNQGGGVSMNSKINVTSEHLGKLMSQLQKVKVFWLNEKRPFSGVLISVHYNKIVAKSNRISGLFKGNESNYSIVGAKFNPEKTKHIITYFLELDDIDKSLQDLVKCKAIMGESFKGGIAKELFDTINKSTNIPFEECSMSTFKQIIADVSYIDGFYVDVTDTQKQQSIVTLYNIGISCKVLLKNVGIDILSSRILDEQTIFLDDSEMKLLFDKMPYLVSMATVNFSELSVDDFITEHDDNLMAIPTPSIEPTIGVIDTLFDKRVYFSEWVDYHDLVDDEIPKNTSDYQHGTAVSSIIVDGCRLNPWLNDGCGRFKVRHFGVASGSKFSSFTIMKQIKSIVENNPDIKVWNLSLGSNQEISDNFISAEGAVLDQLQFNNNVIFVIAGTNKPHQEISKIGSPADSINSLVVNAVTESGYSPKYARRGLALSFFAKPDISYYGGSEEKYIKVCEPLGSAEVAGTSYAAPWIARKLSYLIDVLGLGREVAKAVLIDSARGWNDIPTPEEVSLFGHGIVPIHIRDVLGSKNDEIKFLVSDVSEKWNTYNYVFPVPLKDDKYPYIARATMCYIPLCDRSQGVDYTNTELNLHFGRIKDNGKIVDIKGDNQNQEDSLMSEKNFLLEGEARSRFRKWDNVKYISENVSKRMIPKMAYENKNWGMEIKTNNRLDPKDGVGIRFGVVVTLKEMNGINRIDDFIRSCSLKGWLVREIDIKSRTEIHTKLNEDIHFE